MSRRLSPSRPLQVLLVVVIGVLLLGACTHQRQVPDEYGDTTRDNFQEGCLEALTVEVDSSDPDDGAEAQGFLVEDLGDTEPMSAEQATDVCKCSYEGISDPDTGIPFDEFKEYNSALEDEEATSLPEPMQEIVTTCRDDNAA